MCSLSTKSWLDLKSWLPTWFGWSLELHFFLARLALGAPVLFSLKLNRLDISIGDIHILRCSNPGHPSTDLPYTIWRFIKRLRCSLFDESTPTPLSSSCRLAEGVRKLRQKIGFTAIPFFSVGLLSRLVAADQAVQYMLMGDETSHLTCRSESMKTTFTFYWTVGRFSWLIGRFYVSVCLINPVYTIAGQHTSLFCFLEKSGHVFKR
jgi:hypothetical protein